MWNNYKYSLLSINMKTKVVHHVPRINISIWHMTFDMRNVTCDIWHAKCDMLHVTLLQILTSEHRDENKSCSACPKDQHEHLTYDMRNVICDMQNVTCHMWHNYKYSLLSIDMKTKVVQHVPRINTDKDTDTDKVTD